MEKYNLEVEKILQEIDLTQGKLTKCWEQFVLSNTSQGFIILSEIFSNIESIINSITSINKKNQLAINFNDVENLFVELESSMKINDYQKISDVVCYDLKNELKKWKKHMKKCIKYKLKGENNAK